MSLTARPVLVDPPQAMDCRFPGSGIAEKASREKERSCRWGRSSFNGLFLGEVSGFLLNSSPV